MADDRARKGKVTGLSLWRLVPKGNSIREGRSIGIGKRGKEVSPGILLDVGNKPRARHSDPGRGM
jgi:hypothetical protein